MKQFIDLKLILNNIEDLRLIEPSVFLTPFLEVIRSEETTGQITSLALSAVNKFLSYGLIGECCCYAVASEIGMCQVGGGVAAHVTLT